jgi:hypothetical protein
MAEFITLSCPSCGNKLQITKDIDKFARAACGNEHIVNRSGGIITLKPVLESINQVREGVDKTASELAIVRLTSEIGSLESRVNKLVEEKKSLIKPKADDLIALSIIGLIVGVFVFLAAINGSNSALIFISIIFIIGMIVLYIYRHNKVIRENTRRKNILTQNDEMMRKINFST